MPLPTVATLSFDPRPVRLEDAMDEHGQLEYATASGNDYAAHERMYHTFVTLTKCFVAVIAALRLAS